jgi:hypothetical protein
MPLPHEEYLGDGLYASFDGYQFCLRTPRDVGDHIVYLEPPVLAAFDEYRKAVLKATDALTEEPKK